MALLIVWSAIALASCTLSYQNISTHGSAQDVVDQNQDASPDIKADMNADFSVVPKMKMPTNILK